MSNDNAITTKPKHKPYPWRCGTCGEPAVNPAVIRFAEDAKYEGHTYKVVVPDLKVARCDKCGAMTWSSESANRISEALVKAMGLLRPSQIRQRMNELGIEVDDLATVLAAKSELVTDWVEGISMQPKPIDNLMRVYFEIPQARELLRKHREEELAAAEESALASA